MKQYYPKSHYNKDYRGLVFPLLKPFIKGGNFTDDERIALYGISEKEFQFTDDLEQADLVILTMAWNYYVKTKQTDLAISFVKECDSSNKKVIALNNGDFGVKIPYYKNLIVLRTSGYRSKFITNEFSIPAFIEDPLRKFFKTETVFQRQYSPKPVIGFCGQANQSFLNAVKEIINTRLSNLKSTLGLSSYEAQQPLSTSYLRASVLKKLQQSEKVETNFILRKKYRAGVTQNKDTHKTTLEFYNNLKDSDYVVCVRGAGNFSIRFYEALAMGRIPVFINTDCALPLEMDIDWKKHVVWVDYKERNQVAEKVREFHNALSEKDFIDLQLANRNLWQERLTLNGFFKSLLETYQ